MFMLPIMNKILPHPSWFQVIISLPEHVMKEQDEEVVGGGNKESSYDRRRGRGGGGGGGRLTISYILLMDLGVEG